MPQASVPIRVAFHDVDSSQRIHYTAMFRYMEIAEHELMRSIGFPYARALQDVAFPRVHLACDFRGAIRYDDELIVEARTSRVGGSSWTVAFTAWMKGEGQEKGEVVAEGEMVIVAMNPATEKARPLPEELKEALLGE